MLLCFIFGAPKSSGGCIQGGNLAAGSEVLSSGKIAIVVRSYTLLIWPLVIHRFCLNPFNYSLNPKTPNSKP